MAEDNERKLESYEGLGLSNFNNCTDCLEGTTITPDTLAYFRQYNNCDGAGGFVVVGSITDLDATGHWASVIK